jgi:membrane protease YdiL (CAAX protease family)
MIKRVALFYVTTFVLTILLAGLQQATGIGGTQFILPQWGPGLAALLALLIFRRDGLRLRPDGRPAGVARHVVALGLPVLVAVGLLSVVGGLLAPVDAAAALRALTPLWLAGMLFGALGEEIGWRGYLQPLLRGRLGAFATAAVVGVLWGLWHIQMWANGPLYVGLLVLAMIGYSLVITALVDDAPRSRIALAVLFHLGINLGNVLYFDILTQVGFMAINAAVWLAVAAIFLLTHRDLFFSRESALPVSTASS